ncbi:riboflavin synthase subunit beta [uncultured Lacinutrix sp.]|uniref:riboflavin synthase subunit beta n=1 Tax=uncultured Lacinutrix sp. TaxID=574032 RepID=UPI0026249FAB|nr:riboflavin synthase subunit beta [uncultured Lacinutrix sp.]
MGFMKLRQNKRYNYKPRFYEGEGSPFQMKQKFDEHRTTLESGGNIKQRLLKALEESKTNNNTTVNKRVLIIIAVLVLFFLFLIDFDLSIFF